MSKLSDWIQANKDDPDNHLNVRNYKLNTEMFEREYAEAVEAGNVVECTGCGYPQVIGHNSSDDEMLEHKVCCACWFWLIHMGLKNGPRPNAIIVDGTHYVDSGNKPKETSCFLGFGGSKWNYRKIGETEWTETNNMWHQGKIPKRLGIEDTHELKPYEAPQWQKSNHIL